MANLYAKNFSDADEVKNPPKAKVEVVKLGNVNASKLVLQPGWVCQNVLSQQLVEKAVRLDMLASLYQED